MESKELLKKINVDLKPLGFKRKGNNWLYETTELFKVINLQKSNFSKLYYINYGFIIKDLKLVNQYMHVQNRLSSNEAIDLENTLTDTERVKKLSYLINEVLIQKIISVNTKQDLLKYIHSRKITTDIFLNVKRYFGLVK